MSSQGLSLDPTAAPGFIRKLLFPGVTGVVVGLMLIFFKLFDSQPKEAIELLKAWGPQWMLGVVALAVIAGLMGQLMDISRDGVAAQRQMADAMGRIAEKDDRKMDEMRRMSQYSAQQSDRVVELMSEQTKALAQLSEDIQKHGVSLAELPCNEVKGKGVDA